MAERRRGELNARKADAERASAERTMVEVAAAERRSLARDAHDIVGHGLNVMLLQAGAVRRVLDRFDAEAIAPIIAVPECSRPSRPFAPAREESAPWLRVRGEPLAKTRFRTVGYRHLCATADALWPRK